MAGLSEFVLKRAQKLPALSIEEEEATLAVVQQGADPRRDVYHKDIRLHTLMKKLKSAAGLQTIQISKYIHPLNSCSMDNRLYTKNVCQVYLHQQSFDCIKRLTVQSLVIFNIYTLTP